MGRPPSRLRAPAGDLINAERLLIDGSLTLFSSSSYVGGSQPAASGELHPRPAVALRSLRCAWPPRHPLILDGSDFAPSALRRDKSRLGTDDGCRFVLARSI